MSSAFFFDPTNLLTLPDMIIGNFRYADWQAAKKRGAFGVLREIVLSASGFNTMAFFVPTSSLWTQHDVRALLAGVGVTSWAYGYWNGEMHFSVKKRQAHWAQYVMLSMGVPLLHGLMPTSRALPPRTRALLGARKSKRAGWRGFLGEL